MMTDHGSGDSLSPTGIGSARAINFGVFTIVFADGLTTIGRLFSHGLGVKPTAVLLTSTSVHGAPGSPWPTSVSLYALTATDIGALVTSPNVVPPNGEQIDVHWLAIL